MFSNIGYEAYFMILGLSLHSEILKIITSEVFFRGLALIIFGIIFFITTFRYFSQFSAGTIFQKRGYSLSSIFKVIFIFMIGVSLLKVDSASFVQDYDRQSWHNNEYVTSKIGNVRSEFEVSFVFDLLMRTAQELGAFFNYLVEKMFKAPHSQTKSPYFFYQAAMIAGSAQIEDKSIRDFMSLYIEECAEKAISYFEKNDLKGNESLLDSFFGTTGPERKMNQVLGSIQLGQYGELQKSCLDLKEELNIALRESLSEQIHNLDAAMSRVEVDIPSLPDTKRAFEHKLISSAINNHLNEDRNFVGIEKGVETGGTVGTVFQNISRLKSYAGIASVFNLDGAAESAERAKEFNEILVRAPIIRGVAIMFLSAIFPFLFFWVVAMRWQVLVFWFLQVLGVCLWPAIWNFIYSVMTNSALSLETLAEFGKLSDGISLAGADLINHKLYFYFSVMNWLMIGVAASLNFGLFWMQKTVMQSSSSEHAPAPVAEAASLAKNTVVSKGIGAIL